LLTLSLFKGGDDQEMREQGRERHVRSENKEGHETHDLRLTTKTPKSCRVLPFVAAKKEFGHRWADSGPVMFIL
jgi:hypothetical protein